MAVPRPIPFDHSLVFPHKAYLVSEIAPVRDYNMSTRENFVQETDPETGFLAWRVDVMDGDPQVAGKQKNVGVKILAPHQPVPPKAQEGFPFPVVEFEGLQGTPYVDANGARPRLAWAFRATGFKNAPKAA